MEIREQIQSIAEEIRAQGYEAVCFWMPVKSIGGASYYLYELAEYLLSNVSIKIYYMDFSDGHAHDLFADDSRVNFLDYDPKTPNFPISEPVIIFTNSTKAIQIKNMNPRSKLLFWHFETVPCAWEVVFHDREEKAFMKLCEAEHAMIFHDWSSRNILNRQLSCKFNNKDYLSLFLPPKCQATNGALLSKNTIRLAWLGRLGPEKVQSLYNLIYNFAEYETPFKKQLVIIGDGRKRKDVELFCEDYKNEIDIIFTGTILKEELDEFLVNNADILFAMGTSVLEGAALKIPSVIVQLAMEPFYDNEFIWLFDTEEYCVGIMNYQKKDFPIKYTSFDDIVGEVYSAAEGKRHLGDQCYDAFQKDFSNVEPIALRFLTFCRNTTLTFDKLKKCIKYIPYNTMKIVQYQSHRISIWSIITHRNEKTYKLFGLTLMKIRWVGNDKIFMPFGIRPMLHRFTKTGYQFPTSTFKDPGRSGDQNVIDRSNIMRYKKEQHVAEMRRRLQAGEKLRVCLFVSRISCWTFENLYQIMEKSKWFEPLVVVKPFMFQGKEAMIDYMETTYNALATRGLRVVKGYNKDTDTFLDLKKEHRPDIVFYTKYWLPQFHENFYIDKFLDCLTFYTSYCFDIAEHSACMNFDLNNVVDRYFMPSDIHRQMAERVMRNGAKNVYVTGAPKLDLLMDPTYDPIDVWKPQLTKKKRIIWAPHHSDEFPNNLYQFNAFFELYRFMLEVAETYRDKIQIAFKPHPMLKPKLDQKWGKEVADHYYEQWATLENGQLETGEFIDLFRTSDAMILDCISFIAEYTSVNKPAFFTIGRSSRVQLNDFGMINFEVLYKTESNLKKDIIRFIEEVVIEGNDEKKEARSAFIQDYLKTKNGKSAAENIYDNICEAVFGEGKKDAKV